MRVSFGFTRGRLILVPVRFEHKISYRPDMALDTGARMSLIVPELARALGFEPEKMEPAVRLVSATGPASAALLMVASVSVLGLKVKNLRVMCHLLPPDLGLDGLLGLNFLNHFNIEIDNDTETVTLTARRE